MANTIQAFKRQDGGFGIRNYVLVISLVHCSNTVAQQIAAGCGVQSITHEKGCMEFEDEHAETRLALVCAATNPNVHSVLLVGLGCERTDPVSMLEDIRATGRAAEYVCIQEEGGPPQCLEKGVKIVEGFKAAAAAQPREEVSLEGLVVGVQCGGSDWTTALAGNSTIGAMTDLVVQSGGSVLMSEVAGFPGSEHIVAGRAVSHEAGLAIIDMCDELRADFIADHGQQIEEVNPTPGNKAGGITTLVEKSMGNVKKMGSSPVQGLIHAGQRAPHPGLWVLDTRAEGPDTFCTTCFAMSGAHVDVFSTGRGSPLGNAVMPTLKLTGNPERYKAIKSMLDFNAGVVIEGKDIRETAADLFALLLEVAQGKPTKSELNGNFEFSVPHEKKRGRA